MNYAIVLKLQSVILGTLAVAFAVCLAVAWQMDHGIPSDRSVAGFTVSLVVAGCLSLAAYVFGKAGGNSLFSREALATVGLGWLLAVLVGALPYWLILPGCSFAGAFFESASGFTTTGASVLTNLESLPRSLHLWRGLTQWIGGLGVVVAFVAVLSFLGAGAKVLFSRESSAKAADLNTARVQEGVMRLLKLYLGLSALCTLVFWFCGLGWLDAIVHMFATLSTGGFSTRTGSVMDYHNPALEWAVIVFMAIGGMSFLFILDLTGRNWKAVRSCTECWGYLLLLAGFSAAVAIFNYTAPGQMDGVGKTVRDAAFQVVSIMTTTGFVTADYDQWLPVTHVMLLALMFIGGCSGSTAGGAKVIRLIIALKVSAQQVEKAYRARVVRPLQVNGKHLAPAEQQAVMVYLVMLLLVAFAGTVVVSFLEPSMSFGGTVSAMAACLFNVGPGLAEVGPMRNYAGLHEYTQVVLSLLMVIGRLELFAILVLFSPSLWRRF